MKLKRILALLLCFAMVLGTMGTVAFAEETYVTATDITDETDLDYAVRFDVTDLMDSYTSTSDPWRVDVILTSNTDLILDSRDDTKDGYLSVHLPSMDGSMFVESGWRNLPTGGMLNSNLVGATVEADKPFKVMEYYLKDSGLGSANGLNYYELISGTYNYNGVECGLKLNEAIDGFSGEIALVIYQIATIDGVKQDVNHKTLASYTFGEKPDDEASADVVVDGANVNVAPVDGASNSYDITLAEGAEWAEGTSVTMTFPAVEGASDGDSAYVVHEHEDGTYIYVGTVKNGVISFTNNVGFSTFTVYAGGLQEALAAASSGDEIVLLADVTEDVTIPAGVIFNGNGFAVSGGIIADGNITFAGITKAKDFDVNYVGTTINIGKGASLELTGSDRLVIGHGCTFNIEGNIVDAKTANVAELTPSLIMPGASFTGAGVTFNVKNAYINAPSSYCSSSKSASGTFDFNIANSIIKTAGKLAFEAQSTAATVNFELKDSVLTTGSHLVFGVSKGEIVIDNSDVNVGTSKQIENQSTMTIKNGSVVNGAVATSSNAKNPGTLIIENATYSVTGEFSGSDVGTGTIVIMDGSSFTAGKITNANIRIDAANMSVGDEINLTADLSGLTGTVEVINNNLVANIVDGKIVLAKTPVAAVNGVEYDDIQEAIKAAAPAGTVELLSDVTVEKWIMISETLSISNNTIISLDTNGLTINGNGHTLTINDVESANNGNHIFYDGDYNIYDLNLVMGANVNGLGITSGIIKNVTFTGGHGISGGAAIHVNDGLVNGVHAGNVTIEGCTFENNGGAIYSETAQDGLVVNGNTFQVPSGANVIMFRGTEQFINNTVLSGRTVNVVSGSPVVAGNDFGDVRLKVYNDATAKIEGNTINNLVFDKSIGGIKATFGSNTLSAAAQQALNAVTAPVEVSTYEQLIEELAKENANIKLISGITADAAQSSGYGKAGIVVDAGDVLDGNGHKLTINGANTTWDCVVAMRGGEVKNLTIAGAMRGVFMPGANGDVVVDNCVIEDVIYTFNSDAGSKNHTVTIKNTVLNGWTSFSDAHKAVTFENCDFGEGNGYAFCRPYQKTTFIDCDFAKGYEFDTAQVASNSFEFNNCKYDGEVLSEDSWKMFYNGGSVVINGEQISFMNHDNIVAHIGSKNYDSLASALADADDGAKIELDWNEGDAPIAMNGAVFGKSVTITGTAAVDWSKGFLFIGRGGEGNDTVIFDNANLTSASDQASTGIHVSGREKDTTNKYDGTLVINNSTIELDYLINKGSMILDNSTLTVKNGFSVGGRPASETESGKDATATLTLNNNSKLIVNNHNGMGLGYETIGVMNVNAGSTFQCTQDFLITEKGTMNVDGGNVNVEGKLNVKGTLKSNGNIFGNIVALDTAVIEISGGTYTQDVSAYLAEGYAAIAELTNGYYVVGEAPTATVNNLGAMTIEKGTYRDLSFNLVNDKDMELSFVMQFLADQNAEDMETSPYADWYGDFVITFTGIENNSFTADGCYLAGYYGDFGWIQVPVDGMTIENGARYPVMLGFGAGQKYDYICESVKDFRCAMYLTPEILKANPNLKVNLELSVVDNSQGSDAAKNALIEDKEGTFYKSTSIEYVANDFKEEIKPLQNILAIYNMNTKTQDGVIYYPVHVYAGIDSLNYKEVGFKLKAVNKNKPEGVSYTPTTKTVYRKMNVKQPNGTIKEYDASQLGGTYMFGHEMLFNTLSWKNEDTIIYITPYAKKLDGTEVEGKTIELSDQRIKNEVDENLSLFKETTTETKEEN